MIGHESSQQRRNRLTEVSRVSLSRIDAVIAANLGPARLRGNAQPAALYRQIAMYLANRVCGWSTTRIGKFYNGRDHSTVCHAIRRIDGLRRTDPQLETLIESLARACKETDLPMDARATRKVTGILANTILAGMDGEFLDALADRIAERLVARLAAPAERSSVTHPTGTATGAAA